MYVKKEPKVISMNWIARDDKRQSSRGLQALNLEPLSADPRPIRLRQARRARAQYARERAMWRESSDEAVHGSGDDIQVINERTVIIEVP